MDLVGLVLDGSAAPYRDEVSNPLHYAVASTYKALGRLAPEQRPNYFYPEWWKGLEKTGVLGEELRSFILPHPPIVSGGREVDVYKADWNLINSGDLPRQAPQGSIEDSLSVADLENERDHDYAMHPARIGDQPKSILERHTYPNGDEVVDGGREIAGVESFTAHNLTPGRPLTVVMRTGEPFALRVLVDGEPDGEWHFELKRSNTSWREPSFTVPADLIHSENARIELDPLDSYGAHAPCHYWFVQ